MKNKKAKITKKPAAKSKNITKTSKDTVMLARIAVRVPQSLYNKIKRLVSKNKITLQEIVGVAIKEYINKQPAIKNESASQQAI